jgi:hypothetical protein
MTGAMLAEIHLIASALFTVLLVIYCLVTGDDD